MLLLNINNKWKVIVYYNIDYNLFDYIADDIYYLEKDDKLVNRVYKMMKNCRAKAVTISSPLKKCSVVGFNPIIPNMI